MNKILGCKKIFLLFSLLFIFRANAQNCDSLIIIYSTFNDNGELLVNALEIDSLQNGLVVSRTIDSSRTEYSYDSLSRLIAVKSSTDSTVYSYDSSSRLLTTDYYHKINNVWQYASVTSHVEYYYSLHGPDSILKFKWDGSSMNSFYRFTLVYNSNDTLIKTQTELLDSAGWRIDSLTIVTFTNSVPGVSRIDSSYNDSTITYFPVLISYYDSLSRIVLRQSYFALGYPNQREEFVYDCNQLSEYHEAVAGTHNSENTYFQFDSLCRITNMQRDLSGQSWFGQTLADYYYVGCSTQLVHTGFDLKICKGDSIEISAMHYGGTPPYTVNWFPAQGLASDTVLVTMASPDSTTSYIISVIDANGLVSSDTLIVHVVKPPVASIQISNLDTNSVCQSAELFGDSAQDYFFHWTRDGVFSSLNSHLNIRYNGLYVLEIDISGANSGVCPSAFDTLLFNSFSSIPPDLTLSRSCHEIYANPSVPSQIQWFYNNQLLIDSVRDTLVVSQDGIYSAIAIDSSGCSSTPVQINYTQFVASLIVRNTCMNNCNGEIQARPYISTYLWSNGATTSRIQNLCAGTYTVLITDQFGCMASLTDSVKLIPELEVNYITTGASSDSVCDAIVIPVDSSNTPYNAYYNWGNSMNGNMATAMCAGWHTVSLISRLTGCQQVDSFFIPSSLSADTCRILESHTNMSCNGYGDGTITIGCSTGSPFACYWSSPNSNAYQVHQIHLSAGTYSCLLIDQNGCMDSVQVSILEPPPLALTYSVYQSLCGDSCAVTAIGSGGTPPYRYNWCDQTSGSQFINCMEACRIFLIDSMSCLLIDTVVQAAVSPIVFNTISIPPSCQLCTDGSIIIIASGGVSPYFYSVDNGSPVLNDTIFNLSSGIHNICVTGSDGCSTCSDAEILLSVDSKVSGNLISVSPSPVHDRFVLQISNYNLKNKMSLFIYDALGRMVRESIVESNRFEILRGNLPSGIYSFVIIDNKDICGRGKIVLD